jgi:hypothetical protein
MTMQVAMVGTDGIILASDTKWANTQRRGNLESRDTSLATKIQIDERHGVAIGCSMNMETATAIGDAIVAELSDQDWRDPIHPTQVIGQRVLDSLRERNLFQCLIVSTRPTLRLFKLESATINGEPNRAICRQIKDKAIGGDNANAAVFWTERYYKPKPVQALLSLAAQLIVDSVKFNSGFIGGLEIVICNASGIERLPDDVIAALESEAGKRSRAIGELLFGKDEARQ